MSLVASPPPVCDCCGGFPGLAEGGSEKALISLAALGSLAAAELSRRFDSANYPVRDLDGFKPRRSKTFVLCRQASFARCTYSRLSRPTRRTRAVGALCRIVSNLETI
jgi:hypothetical protein